MQELNDILRGKENIKTKDLTLQSFDVQRECPGVSLDLIRRVLKNLRSSSEVECLGRGQNAKWQRKEKGKQVLSNEIGNELGNVRVWRAPHSLRNLEKVEG